MFFIKKDGKLVKHVIFEGNKDDLYRDKKIIELEFKTLSAANEVNFILKGEVVTK